MNFKRIFPLILALPQSHLQLRLCAGRCLRKRNRRPVRRRVRGRPRHFAGILNHTQAADENRRLKLSKKPFRLFRQKDGRPACMVCTNVGILILKLCRNPHLIWC